MIIKTIIPERYSSSKCRTIDTNVYEIFEDYVKLKIINRLTQKVVKTVYFDKDDLHRVSQLHWTAGKHTGVPYSRVDQSNITTTFGKYITGSYSIIYGKIKGKPEWDFRKGKYTEVDNIFSAYDENTMQMALSRKDGTKFKVLFDKEDLAIISKYRWFIVDNEKKENAYTVSAGIKNKIKSLHIFILEANKKFQYAKSFDLKCKNNVFDMRKSELYKFFADNTYLDIDKKTKELTIKYSKGEVKIIFDSKDFKRISAINWGYILHGQKEKIINYKFGQLKHFILGLAKSRQIREIKDEKGRWDYRSKTLLSCLLKDIPVRINSVKGRNIITLGIDPPASEGIYRNEYEITDEYIKLLIIDRRIDKTIRFIFFERYDYEYLIKHNWRISSSHFSAYTFIDKKRISVGEFLYGKNIHILKIVKGETEWDFRNNFHGNVKNVYSIINEQTMQLDIYRRDIDIYTVVFDKSDFPLLCKYVWSISKLKGGEYRVIPMNINESEFLHLYILKNSSKHINCTGLKDINHKNRLFDYRKSLLYEKQGLNIYTHIDSVTTELCINSANGKIKVLIDKEDYPKVSEIIWGFTKSNMRKGYIKNEKYGQLLKFILGLPKSYLKHFDVSNNSGWYDFRKQNLKKHLKEAESRKKK
jgi:hypothetical protein